MDNFIFDKTDKGREEIITRKYRLASRLRSLLVLIDGKKTTSDLLQKVAGLGLDMQSLADLLDGDFIESVAILPETEEQQLTSFNQEAMASTIPVVNIPDPDTTNIISYATSGVGSSASSMSSGAGTGLIDPEKSIALQKFFNQTIRSVIGLRGFTLQLKAEQAHTLEEFKALREGYLAAVLKAKGNETMISLRDRLDQLLADAEQSIR